METAVMRLEGKATDQPGRKDVKDESDDDGGEQRPSRKRRKQMIA